VQGGIHLARLPASCGGSDDSALSSAP
jgi:hypothetical protein